MEGQEDKVRPGCAAAVPQWAGCTKLNEAFGSWRGPRGEGQCTSGVDLAYWGNVGKGLPPQEASELPPSLISHCPWDVGHSPLLSLQFSEHMALCFPIPDLALAVVWMPSPVPRAHLSFMASSATTPLGPSGPGPPVETDYIPLHLVHLSECFFPQQTRLIRHCLLSPRSLPEYSRCSINDC